MSDDVFEAALERARRHCSFTGQRRLRFSFHGGEPCLIGPHRFRKWCDRIRSVLSGLDSVTIGIQTNGTLVDSEWAKAFKEYQVDVGISMDGPREFHDAVRVDHEGRGSFQRVQRAVDLLRETEVVFGFLCVIPLGADPLAVHRHFNNAGSGNVTYLLPHHTHDTIAEVRERFGPTPCADFLIPVFDDWWFNGTLEMQIGDLRNICRIIMGGKSQIETLGNDAPRYVFVEADGEIEGLDNLKICENGLSKTHLNVVSSDFRDLLNGSTMHNKAIFEGMPAPSGCELCPEKTTCSGGYLPHRYSKTRGFDNPSVWCADILKIFAHIRHRLGVTVEETHSRSEEILRRWESDARSIIA